MFSLGTIILRREHSEDIKDIRYQAITMSHRIAEILPVIGADTKTEEKNGEVLDILIMTVCYVNAGMCKDRYFSVSCRLICVALPGSRAFGHPLHTAFVT